MNKKNNYHGDFDVRRNIHAVYRLCRRYSMGTGIFIKRDCAHVGRHG